ncbi:hypothetical protein CsatB_023464 [Cannabis sativa]
MQNEVQGNVILCFWCLISSFDSFINFRYGDEHKLAGFSAMIIGLEFGFDFLVNVVFSFTQLVCRFVLFLVFSIDLEKYLYILVI